MRVEEEIAGMPSYADECPNCRLSSDVDCVHVYVHPIQTARKTGKFPSCRDDMSPRYRLSHQSAPATSYSTLVARSYVESLAWSSLLAILF